MRFRTLVTNSNLLLRVVQSIDKLSKSAMLKLTPTKLHIIVVTDLDSGLQLWSDIAVDALFSEYQIESVHNNEIYLEFNIDNLQRALRSTQSGALGVTLKLTKKQGLPVLSLTIRSQSASGREISLCQDVPVRMLTPQQMSQIREPMVPDGNVHFMMPPLNNVRSIAERMKGMGDRVAVSANREGEMNVRVANDLVDITTYFRGLETLAYDTTQEHTADRETSEFYTAVVDMKHFVKFLQSYHVAPKNIVCCIVEGYAVMFYVYIGSAGYSGAAALNDTACGSLTYFIPGQMGGQPQNPPMRGAFSPISAEQQQQFAYNSYPNQQQPQNAYSQPQPTYPQPQYPQQQQQQPFVQPVANQSTPYGMFAQNLQNNQAAQIGMQFAGNAMNAMQENVQQNVERYVSMRQLKHYFDVSNIYVLSKLRALVFPWMQKSWHRYAERDQTGQVVGYKSPREDVNSPDLYIPVMGLVSYVIVIGLIIGRLGVFHPEDLGYTASSALGVIVFEVLLIKMFCYLLNVGSELQFLDIVAFSGYKFVTTILVVLLRPWAPWWITWSAFLYFGFALVFFMIRSLRHALIPESSSVTGVNVHRKRRIHFLFVIAMTQFLYIWILMQYKSSN
ncbi:Transport protein yif1 [Coemansia sp. S680]|nr:Transport protein yif1 [Coemansia sp. S680]